MQLIAQGRFRKRSRSSCATIHYLRSAAEFDHPCTDACTRAGVDDPLNLPGLKRFVTDYFPDSSSAIRRFDRSGSSP